jgi:Mlc titration factor MtfA (ptsG expression regulator)
MSWNVKTWYRRRVLENESIPDNLWREAVARLRCLRGLSPIELKRLRECVTLFLHAKQISGAHELVITGEMHVMIAAQACILILNLDLDYYEGWVEIIVYPGEFIRDYEYVDEDGVVHRAREAVSGESWLGGPVILSWEDTAVAGEEAGYNVVIHEFAHKLDMLNGDANGSPPLHADMSQQAWSEAFSKAYAIFCLNVDANEMTVIDPYAAENPAEFFAVISEAFFEMPLVVKLHFPAVYEQLALFYRQDPALRWGKS